jgi:hypothetical protein
VSIGSEAANYYLDCKITNVTTGEYLWVKWPMTLNYYVTVDCDQRRVTYSDGSRIQGAVTLGSDRVDWLNLAYGTNQLKFEDTGTQSVDVVVTWYDKVGF